MDAEVVLFFANGGFVALRCDPADLDQLSHGLAQIEFRVPGKATETIVLEDDDGFE